MVYLVTEKTRDHLTPELKLALVTPKTQAYKLSQEQFPFKDPYWYVLFAKISSSYFHPGLRNLSTKKTGSGSGFSAQNLDRSLNRFFENACLLACFLETSCRSQFSLMN
jgi:hypothetical protein